MELVTLTTDVTREGHDHKPPSRKQLVCFDQVVPSQSDIDSSQAVRNRNLQNPEILIISKQSFCHMKIKLNNLQQKMTAVPRTDLSLDILATQYI